MAKQTKTSAEIQQMIVDAVRAHRGCEDFRSISIYKIVDPSAAGVFNWSLSVANYGEAAPERCNKALRSTVPQLQRQYDLSDD